MASIPAVLMFKSMGVATGIGLERLAASRRMLRVGWPGKPLHGMVVPAGLGPGFADADGRRPVSERLPPEADGAPA